MKKRRRYGAHPDASKHRMLAIKQVCDYVYNTVVSQLAVSLQKLAEHKEAVDGIRASSNISKAVDSVILDSLSTSDVLHRTEEKTNKTEMGVGQDHCEGVPLLPVEVIKRHRLSLQEIKALPRFSGYELGKLSKVCLVAFTCLIRILSGTLCKKYSSPDNQG